MVCVYKTGIARPGMDDLFHALDRRLRLEQNKKETGCIMRGDDLHNLLDFAARSHNSQQKVFAPPHNCNVSTEACVYDQNQWQAVSAQQKGRYYACQVSDPMAGSLLTMLLWDMEENRRYLVEKMKTHGDLVLTRWTKKSQDKRAAILRKVGALVFPTFGGKACPCPDCTNNPFMKHHIGGWVGGAWASQDSFEEDRMRLLSLLHVRTKWPPDVWATFDMRQSVTNWKSTKSSDRPLFFNEKCVVMHGAKYGTLARYDYDLARGWAIVGFPRAFTAFQAQQELMFVLRDIVDAIVDDADGTGCAKWSALAASGFHASGQEARWSPYLDQALAPPIPCHPKALLDKAESRLVMVLDDVWLMQTEPAYMQQILKSRKAHTSNICKNVGVTEQYGVVSTDLLVELSSRIVTWQCIVDACQVLCREFEKYGNKCFPGKVLPVEVSIAFAQLGAIINDRLLFSNATLEDLLPAIAPMKSRFRMTPGSRFEKKKTLDPEVPADHIRYHLKILGGCIRQERRVEGLAYSFKMFELEMCSFDSAAAQVDRRLFDLVSDMAVLDDLLTMCQWSQYGVRRVGNEVGTQLADTVPDPKHETGHRWRSFRDTSCHRLEEDCTSRLGTLAKNIMESPWPKSSIKDHAWLEKATSCRNQSAMFWKSIREEAQRGTSGTNSDQAWMKRFAELISFDVQPEFLLELELERELCGNQKSNVPSANADEGPLASELQTVWGVDGRSAQPRHRRQTKAKKSRDMASSINRIEHDMQELVIHDSGQHQDLEDKSDTPIAVTLDSLNGVFRKMYPSDGSDAKGEVRWPVFLQAMGDAGFAATEASGSAVSFSNGVGSICFHRPHPNPVVDHIMLRNMAKRMQKWFGWHGSLFVLREKGAVQ